MKLDIEDFSDGLVNVTDMSGMFSNCRVPLQMGSDTVVEVDANNINFDLDILNKKYKLLGLPIPTVYRNCN